MKKLLYITLLISTMIIKTLDQKDLPEPYASIKLLPYNMQSFFGEFCANSIKKIIDEIKPKIALEVGSWHGASAIFTAQNLSDDAKFYAVDHWLGQKIYPGTDRSKEHKTLYQQFLSNVIHSGLSHKITPIRMESLLAAEQINVKPDLIYIDANHEEEDVYNDIMAWYPVLNEGGVLCGDDWSWGNGQPVQKAVVRAAKKLKLEIEHNAKFWRFKGTKQTKATVENNEK
ncbi:MAG: hypothetical protein UR26_C0001G0127 [candidate division TM6 bacterium GW2011_GWF2_32_72]|nr:MAG: hypothetical protein UR26_C0001G0127 [candidate division TM6 bacterium GW2011_GWF2_32_72]